MESPPGREKKMSIERKRCAMAFLLKVLPKSLIYRFHQGLLLAPLMKSVLKVRKKSEYTIHVRCHYS
jgi:hypothetical protein